MAETTTARCVHHWQIEPPDGSQSLGSCSRCGAQRTFTNTPADVYFDRSGSLSGPYRPSVRGSQQRETVNSDI